MGDRLLCAADDGLAFHDIAGIVDPTAELSRLAEEFTAVEGVSAWNGHRHRNLQGRLLSVPARNVEKDNGADWPLIHVGKPFQLINCPTRWLKRARTIRQLKPNDAIYDRRLPGYELRCATPDQRRRVFTSRSEQLVVVKDDRRRTLLSIDDDTRDASVGISDDGNFSTVLRSTSLLRASVLSFAVTNAAAKATETAYAARHHSNTSAFDIGRPETAVVVDPTR